MLPPGAQHSDERGAKEIILDDDECPLQIFREWPSDKGRDYSLLVYQSDSATSSSSSDLENMCVCVCVCVCVGVCVRERERERERERARINCVHTAPGPKRGVWVHICNCH